MQQLLRDIHTFKKLINIWRSKTSTYVPDPFLTICMF